jgi:hypothetical protein
MVRLQNVSRAAELLKAEISAPVFGESAVALLDEVEAIRNSAYEAVCELPASGLRVMGALLSTGTADRCMRKRRVRAYFHCLRAIRKACRPKATEAASVRARSGDWSGYYRWKARRVHANWCLLKLTAYGLLFRMGYNVDLEDSIERLSSLI